MELFPQWVPDPVIQAGATVLVLVVAYGVSRLLVRLFGRRIARRYRRPSLTRTILRGLKLGVFLLAFLTILRIYGMELSDIALSVTVFTAVLGVILAPIVGSIISGVFLLADQPYEIGDMIELVDQDRRGFVEDITLRYTKIFTMDNTFLVIPNGTMRERDVINYSAEDPRTRLTLSITVTYESDVPRARQIVESAARSTDGVIEGGPNIRVGAERYPSAPTCYIDEYGDHGILLTLRYWVTEPYRLLATRSRIYTSVLEAIQDEDVEIAYPHSHLFFDDTSGELQVSADRRDAVSDARTDVNPDAPRDPRSDAPADSQPDAPTDDPDGPRRRDDADGDS
ncbi:mechanosensitive ion channel family protein [Halomicrobium urmianum]|uniref:mechanosensitive ion channel family protein n=1 Tax=Halomicrobium urmianum TaxID=1586233 RepID=UPI001CD99B7B|nr:mechanosensitive ion channel family protein [Halomicrobium urmianum]